jgi:hypothetical protein
MTLCCAVQSNSWLSRMSNQNLNYAELVLNPPRSALIHTLSFLDNSNIKH